MRACAGRCAWLLLALLLTACQEGAEAPERVVQATGPHYRIETDQGAFSVALDTLQARRTAGCFADRAAAGFYDGAVFDRRLGGEMIVSAPVAGLPAAPDSLLLEQETGVHDAGVVSMVRREDPLAIPGTPERPDYLRTSGNAFFICLSRLSHLDGRYAAFGEVRSGMKVVRKISSIREGEDPRILRVTLIDTPE